MGKFSERISSLCFDREGFMDLLMGFSNQPMANVRFRGSRAETDFSHVSTFTLFEKWEKCLQFVEGSGIFPCDLQIGHDLRRGPFDKNFVTKKTIFIAFNDRQSTEMSLRRNRVLENGHP